jgi:hypothetical protein
MLESVLFARDKWLTSVRIRKQKDYSPNRCDVNGVIKDNNQTVLIQDGILFPTRTNLYLAPIIFEEYYSSRTNFFNNVYGIDMSPLM